MKLESLIMEDFRQFHGVAELEFSSGSEESVTVIHGENGVGKTTILNAIHWCLYGTTLRDFEKPEMLVNDVARDQDGESKTRVELSFSHNDATYRVERIYDQKKKESQANGFKIVGGNNETIDTIPAVINRIIPSTMAPYFFFHGEGLNSLSASSGQQTFREAIRAILGFNHADSALDHLKQTRIKWQKDISKLARIDAQGRKALEQYSEAEQAIDDAQKELSECNASIESIELGLADINEQIAAINVQDVSKLQAKRQKLELRRRAIPGEIQHIKNEQASLIRTYGWSLFGLAPLKESAETLHKFQSDRKLPSEYNDRFVNSLLDEGMCICGTALAAGSEEYEKVTAMLAGASTSEQEDAITAAIGIAENIVDVSDEFVSRVSKLARKEQGLSEELGTIGTETRGNQSENYGN